MSDSIEEKIALEKLVNSSGRSIYIEALEEYWSMIRSSIDKIDPELSALKYNEKDIILTVIKTIDTLTTTPISMIADLSVDNSEEDIQKSVDILSKNTINEAKKYVNDNKML